MKKLSGQKSYKLFVISFWLIFLFFVPFFARASSFAKPSFVKAKDLQIGDVVYVLDNGQLKAEEIVEKEWVDEPTEVYNLTVDNDQTFFANGLAVHNKNEVPKAYFFWDEDMDGYHDPGESVVVNGASAAYNYLVSIHGADNVSPMVEGEAYATFQVQDIGPEDLHVLNNESCENSGGLETIHDKKTYGSCGDGTGQSTPWTFGQTHRGADFRVGGLNFPDYLGDAARPGMYYRVIIAGDNERLQFVGTGSQGVCGTTRTWADFKSEKDYQGETGGFCWGQDNTSVVQIAEFVADYSDTYYFKHVDCESADGQTYLFKKSGGTPVYPGVIGISLGEQAAYGGPADVETYDIDGDGLYFEGEFLGTIGCGDPSSFSLQAGQAYVAVSIFYTDYYYLNNSRKSGFLFWEAETSKLTDVIIGGGSPEPVAAIPLIGRQAMIQGRVFKDLNKNCLDDDNMVPEIRNQVLYCYLNGSCGDAVLTKDNRAFYRSRPSGGSWSAFAENTSAAQAVFAPFGGMANIQSRSVFQIDSNYYDRVVTTSGQMWERVRVGAADWGVFLNITNRPDIMAAYGLPGGVGDIGGVANIRIQTLYCYLNGSCGESVLTKDNRAFYRSRPSGGSWSFFTEITSAAQAVFAPFGGMANIQSRSVFQIDSNYYDRVVTTSGQMWERVRVGAADWGAFSDITNEPSVVDSYKLIGGLSANLSLGGPESDSTSSDGVGKYSFTAGTAGSYTVSLTVPPNYGVTSGCGSASETVIITQDDLAGLTKTVNFPLTKGGIIKAQVWDESGGSSCAFDSQDGVDGISISLAGPESYSGLTGEDGTGIKSFTASAGSGYQLTINLAGTNYKIAPHLLLCGISEITCGGGLPFTSCTISNISLEEGETIAYDLPIISTGSISGKVFADYGLDCVESVGGSDVGVSGVTVYLDSWGINPKTTNIGGQFSYSNLTPGDHTVYIDPPSEYLVNPDCGYSQSAGSAGENYYQTVSVSGGSAASVSFAILHTGTISGYVYVHDDLGADCGDLGGDGSTPAEDVNVYSTQGSSPSDSTDSSGFFDLGTLIAGTYILNVDNLPSGFQPTDAMYCPQRSTTIDPANGGDFSVKIGLLTSHPWWQVVAGDIHADGGGVGSNIPPSSVCTGDCKPYLMLNDPDAPSGEQKPGVVSFQSGSVEVGEGGISEGGEDWQAKAGSYEGQEYNYAYWEDHLAEEDIQTRTNSSFSLPNSSGVYKYTANSLTIRPSSLSSGRKVVILHPGSGTVDIVGDITVEQGGFLMLVSAGSLEIDIDVTQVQGIYIAENVSFEGGVVDSDGNLDFQGILVGWNTIDLSGRAFGDSGLNRTTPIFTFSFRPDLLIEATEVVKRAFYPTWREIVP